MARDPSSTVSVLLIFLTLLEVTVSEVMLRLDRNYYHIRITNQQLQEQSQTALLTVILSRPLLEEEHIADARVLGQNNEFELNSTTLTVYAVGRISPGRHNAQIVIIIGVTNSIDFVLSVPLTVDIIAEGPGESCSLQPFGKCSHFCTEDNLSSTGYICSCEVGYSLQLNEFTCLANDPIPLLLFSDTHGIHSFLKLFNQSSILLSESSVTLFDYSYRNKVLYYVVEHQSIKFTSFVNGEEGPVMELYQVDSGVIGGLLYDWINEAIIFSHVEFGLIAKINISTKDVEVLFSSLEKPRNLAIQGNIGEQQLAWIESEMNSTVIKMVDVSTGEISVLVENLEDEPIDIDIDIVTGKLYWITINGKLQSCTTTETKTIYEFKNSIPTAIAVFEVYAYIVFQRNHSIIRVDLMKPEGLMRHLYQVNSSISDISIYHPLKQPTNRSVSVLNCSDCEQLCTISRDNIQCVCTAGYRLSPDGHSCHPLDTFQLFLTSSVEVNGSPRGIVVSPSLDGVLQAQIVDSSFGLAQTPVSTGLIYALAFDISSKSIFFGDRNSSTLWMVSTDRITNLQDNRMLLAANVHAWGMTYDWIHEALYWTDDKTMSIGRMQISTVQTNSTEIVLAGLQSPRGIAVDPINGWLYWIEAGESPSVSRQMLNGHSRQVLVNSNLSNPSGLTINFLTGMLYWGDTGRIQEMNLMELTRKTFHIDPDIEPFQITTIEEYVAFTINNRTEYGIFEIDTKFVSLITYQSNNPGRLMYGITALSQSKEPTRGQYLCYFNSLNCSHFCNTDEEDNPSCECPTNYSLLGDEITCLYEDVCPECANGGTCSVHGRDIHVSCSCAAGFTGEECNQECPPDTFGMNCIQQCMCINGTCNSIDGDCECFPEYTGQLCNQPICSPPCQNGGNCIAPDICLCPESYNGQSCETRVCTPDYCLNGGTCFVDFGVDLSCRCPTTASGPQCQFNNDIEFNPLSGSELGTAVGVPLGVIVLLLIIAITAVVVIHYVRLFRRKKVLLASI